MNQEFQHTPKHLEIFVRCKNADNPPDNVTSWVDKGKLYVLKGLTRALNSTDENEFAAVIANQNGDIIKPTNDMFTFKANRFETAFEFCKN